MDANHVLFTVCLSAVVAGAVLMIYHILADTRHAKKMAVKEERRRAIGVVDEYLHWLGAFPLVTRALMNLRAELNGEGLNAGTPGVNDNVTVQGLRAQLSKLAWDGSGEYQEGCPCQKCEAVREEGLGKGPQNIPVSVYIGLVDKPAIAEARAFDGSEASLYDAETRTGGSSGAQGGAVGSKVGGPTDTPLY